MQRAGYLSRDGKKVLDGEGIPREVLELTIHGARLCILVDELVNTLQRGTSAGVEKIKQNWMEYLGGRVGSAQVSRSGKALNIELVNGDRYTLSLDSIREVLGYRERVVQIMELPVARPLVASRDHRITDYCMPAQSFCAREGPERMIA